MSDRPDLDEAAKILHAGGFKITGGKYAPVDPKTGTRPTLGTDSHTTQSNAELDCTDLTHEQIERILHWHISAQQQLLQGLIKKAEKTEQRWGDGSGWDIIYAVPLSVIQNKLEGLS